MKNYIAFGFVLATICGLFIATACRQQPQSRQYEENGATAALPAQAAPQETAWHWAMPSKWRKEGSSGLRLATFFIVDPEGTGQCTLIPLTGDGGGVQANVQRWLDQLHLPRFSQPEMADFLTIQKKVRTGSGLPVTIIDFTPLNNPQERSGTSLLVAVITGKNETLFVKMSGGKVLLKKNREVFSKFCLSLSPGA
ncbi:MAG: hypothetical protein WCL37_00040 [Chrysiogenales bacterium]